MNVAYITSILPPVICSMTPWESDLVLLSMAYGTSLSRLKPTIYYSDDPLLRCSQRIAK